MPSFAERELTKFGWEKGQGLGKSGGGLKKAITVGVKNNTGGLGTDDKAWGFQWWDHIFNKTTAGITIEQDDEGEVQILKASVSVQKQQEKALLYGAFVKSSDATETKAVDENKDYSIKITDEELLRACGGRTARKGARAHQPGKLRRTDGHALIGHDSDDDAPRANAPQARKRKHSDDSDESDNDQSMAGLGMHASTNAAAGALDASALAIKPRKVKKTKEKKDKEKKEKKDKKEKREKKEKKLKTRPEADDGVDRKDGKKDKKDKKDRKSKKSKRSSE